MRILMFRLVMGCSLVFMSCLKDDPASPTFLPLPPSTEGTWEGTTMDVLTLSLQISQDVTQISGTGTIKDLASGATFTGGLTGSNTYPNVLVTFTIPGFFPVEITGLFASPTTIVAELNESGFSHFPITFYKQ